MLWLPGDLAHPLRTEVDGEYHLRPIHAGDVDLDVLAVMGSQRRLWSIYGEAWGWPPADMTAEQDREDLAGMARPVWPRRLILRATSLRYRRISSRKGRTDDRPDRGTPGRWCRADAGS